MSDLIGQGVDDTLENLLQVDGGVDGTLKTVEDGVGNDSALQISTTEVNVNGTLSVNGVATGGGVSTDGGIEIEFVSNNLIDPSLPSPAKIKFAETAWYTPTSDTIEILSSHHSQYVFNKTLFDCNYYGMVIQDEASNYCLLTANYEGDDPTPTAPSFLYVRAGNFTDPTKPVTLYAGQLGGDEYSAAFKLAACKEAPLILCDSDNTGLRIDNTNILDINNNEIIQLNPTASAVNNVQISNNTTGASPSIEAVGDDTDVDIIIKGQGDGVPVLGKSNDDGVALAANQALLDNSKNELVSFTKTSSAVNQVNITNAATTGSPKIAAKGDDANVDITMSSQGTGKLILESANNTTPVTIKSGTALQHTTNIVIPDTAQTRTITLPDANVNLTTVVCRAYLNTTNNVSSTPIKLTYNTLTYDVGSSFDVSTFKFTPQVSGYYSIYAQYYVGVTVNNTFSVSIYKNGVQLSVNNVLNALGSATVIPSTQDICFLNGSTDYIEVYAFSNTATPFTITAGSATTFVTFNRVG